MMGTPCSCNEKCGAFVPKKTIFLSVSTEKSGEMIGLLFLGDAKLIIAQDGAYLVDIIGLFEAV